MALAPKDKELVAIGASIGAGCDPCLEHHIPVGRSAGLTEPQLARAVEVAEDAHRFAVELLSGHSRELVPTMQPWIRAALHTSPASRADELVALGASIGANCHPLLQQCVSTALDRGMEASQVRSAIKMAEIVQQPQRSPQGKPPRSSRQPATSQRLSESTDLERDAELDTEAAAADADAVSNSGLRGVAEEPLYSSGRGRAGALDMTDDDGGASTSCSRRSSPTSDPPSGAR